MKFKKVKIESAGFFISCNYSMQFKFLKNGKISVVYKPKFTKDGKKFKLTEEESLKFDRKLRNINLDNILNVTKERDILDGEEWSVSVYYDDSSVKDFKIHMPYNKNSLQFIDVINWAIKKVGINSGV